MRPPTLRTRLQASWKQEWVICSLQTCPFLSDQKETGIILVTCSGMSLLTFTIQSHRKALLRLLIRDMEDILACQDCWQNAHPLGFSWDCLLYDLTSLDSISYWVGSLFLRMHIDFHSSAADRSPAGRARAIATSCLDRYVGLKNPLVGQGPRFSVQTYI